MPSVVIGVTQAGLSAALAAEVLRANTADAAVIASEVTRATGAYQRTIKVYATQAAALTGLANNEFADGDLIVVLA